MGDKLASKRMAMKANVNIIPGYDGIVKVPLYVMVIWLVSGWLLFPWLQDADEAIKLAKDIGEHYLKKTFATFVFCVMMQK